MVKSKPSMEKNGNNNEISDGVSVLIASCLLAERKTKQSKIYVSYRLVGLGYYIDTGKNHNLI